MSSSPIFHLVSKRYAKEFLRAGYSGILGRDADEAGPNSYAREMAATGNLSTILGELSHSEEAWKKNLYRRPDELVRLAFIGLLAREPEQEVLESHAGQLAQNGSLPALLAELARSQEHWEKMLARKSGEVASALCKGILGQDPDADILDACSSMLASQARLEDIASIICDSDLGRRASLARTIPGIVRGIYLGMLGREPEVHELNAGIARLDSSCDVRDLVSDLSKGRIVRSNHAPAPEGRDPIVAAHSVVSFLSTPTTPARSIVFMEGFHTPESGFVWSEADSSLIVNGDCTFYLSCNYLAPPGTRQILIADGEQSIPVTLDDPYGCHEIKIKANKRKLINFSADNHLVPQAQGLSPDTRKLAFQLWFDIPDSLRVVRTPAVKNPGQVILCVFDTKKEADSLLPIYQRLLKSGIAAEFLDMNAALARAERNNDSSQVFLIAAAKPYIMLFNANCGGRYIYAEHGASPLKRYTYNAHYRHYDLVLLPGALWTRRLGSLYPETAERCRVVGYPKLQAPVLLSAIERRAMCTRLGIDPAKKIILFAPSWSGGNRECGLFNMRFFDKTENSFAIPHDGDLPFVKEIANLGYKIHALESHESISDYYHLADMLVSDISSTAVEFAALGKPVICLAMSEIPDYDPAFSEGESRLRIPHTDAYWDFCTLVRREEISQAIQAQLDDTWSKHIPDTQGHSVKMMIDCFGDEAADRCVASIAEFLKDRALVFHADVEQGE